MRDPIQRKYSVAIDTVPLPEDPAERIEVVLRNYAPVINQMMKDVMMLAIGTWPTPEEPRDHP
ncbi:MAG: hypothetical protein PVJ32_06850 [Anaerolineales bacterium]